MSDRIFYSSTNLKAPSISFGEALLSGIAPDRGLYMPSRIPVLEPDLISSFSEMSYPEIAAHVLNAFLGTEISYDKLLLMAREAYNFDLPLEEAGDNLWIMRLDRGPTASFKDFAARMMARLMQYFTEGTERKLVVLVATSGDTGSAIASAFHKLEGIEVVILFPHEEVSENQRRQMTTLGDNIRVISVDGKFDDCQRLAKEAFADTGLSHIHLTSANSINIGRLLPQSVYYLYAWSRLAQLPQQKMIFAVPSGNFGNLMGGLIAKRMGLPVEKFIAATNSNDEFPEFLRKGRYEPLNPSLNCISNAMNVGHPSNLARIVSLYGGRMDELGNIISYPDLDKLREDIRSFAVSDETTMATISRFSGDRGILVEQHGAVALAAVQEYRGLLPRGSGNRLTVALETAHPAKFPEVLTIAAGMAPEVPESLAGLFDREESITSLENDYNNLREFLLTSFS
jgi:threonine synthase